MIKNLHVSRQTLNMMQALYNITQFILSESNIHRDETGMLDKQEGRSRKKKTKPS
jgi:hypothetical protein